MDPRLAPDPRESATTRQRISPRLHSQPHRPFPKLNRALPPSKQPKHPIRPTTLPTIAGALQPLVRTSMHLMVLGASRPRHVVRCPAWGNGPRNATSPKAPLDRAAHRPLKQTLPSSRKGRHRRASRGSAPPDVDAAMRVPRCPCLSFQTMKRRYGSQDRVLGTVVIGHVNCCAVQPRT